VARRFQATGRRGGASNEAWPSTRASHARSTKGPRGRRIGAFFDLDRTIIAGFSALAFWFRWSAAGKVSAGGLTRAALATLSFGLGRSDFSSFVAQSASLLEGVLEEDWSRLGENLFSSWLAGDVFPETRALIRAHQRAGHSVAIVSSATRYQIVPVAADLAIDQIMCTNLEVCEGKFTGKVVRPTCYGEGKARAASAFAAANGRRPRRQLFLHRQRRGHVPSQHRRAARARSIRIED
jgi:putative phosphoserine phosphatase/1-acylglycerol-3-phosphate O-acyltransferase